MNSAPVSAALEAQLRTELQRRGLLLWLDLDSAFTQFVGALSLPVVPFRGSWLEWITTLAERPEGLDPTPLLLYVPAHTPDALRDTPLFPWLPLAHPFSPSLADLVRTAAAGHVAPARMDAFLHSTPLTLESADAWLSRETRVHDTARTAIFQQVAPTVLVDDLLARMTNSGNTKLVDLALDTAADLDALEEHLHIALGMSPDWRAFCARARLPVGARAAHPRVSELRDALTLDALSWVLCVEYVHDLARAPHLDALAPLRALPGPLQTRCRALARHLRAVHRETYPSLADETELLIREGELRLMRPEDLGNIDTFRYEEQSVLQSAVDGLLASEWSRVLAFADLRLNPERHSFWLHQSDEWSRLRKWIWTLVREAAVLGDALQAHPSEGAFENDSLDASARSYAERYSTVDRAHRHFEQRVTALLDSRMEHYGKLQESVMQLRVQYRAWADALARAFTSRCRALGFLPTPDMQQRTLFEQVVHPRVERGLRVAVFLVDAMRFEMARDLADQLRDARRTVDLKPRLAELPTLTAVGMNALAPVAKPNGRLELAGEFTGFRAGEFTVSTPDDRARAMGQRSLGKTKALLLSLSEICSPAYAKDLTKLVPQRKLIVVQSREIDDAGEANLGVRTFESTLADLTHAWRLLHAAGVDVCVFTADHGFLLQDSTTHTQPFGTKKTPKRRFVFDKLPLEEKGMVPVALSALQYDGLDGYLLFRDDTAVFATGTAGASFVHGGNSPQERVIPVLIVEAPREKTAKEQELKLRVEAMAPLLGHHRVRLKVERVPDPNAPALALGETQLVEVALRVRDRGDVTVSVRDVSGAGTLRGNVLLLTADAEWTECFFALEGERDERVQMEVHQPSNAKLSASLDAWFGVAGVRTSAKASAKTPEGAEPSEAPAKRSSASSAARPDSREMKAVKPNAWAEAFTDEGVRAVFLHLAQHGAIDEGEATTKLGNPRAFRKFSLGFDEHVQRLPFKVRVEATAGGKRYVKESDK